MRIRFALSIAILTLGLVCALPGRAAAQGARFDVSLTVFNDGLASYGDWVASARFGRVWAPRGVRATWRPYSVGYWAYTDLGWTWVSDEPWGWATYHYGRWAFDPEFGWIWVPDTVWGPSWVAWRYSDEVVGWAPLPPDVEVREEFEPVIEPSAFIFVRTPYLMDRRLVTYIEPPARNVTYVRFTSNETHFVIRGAVVVNSGVRVEAVERATGRAVPRLRVEASETAAPARVGAGRIVMYHPASVAAARPAAPLASARPMRAAESPAAMESRHAQELRAFEAEQTKARAALEARHRAELSKPPAGVTRQQLLARQDAEHKAQQENEARQRQVLAARQQREKEQQRGH